MVSQIYPSELQLNKTNTADTEAAYLGFFCGSLMFLFCVVFAMSVRVCVYVLCGHLLGKG